MTAPRPSDRHEAVTDRLRRRGEPGWIAAIDHPMVVAIGAGTLPHDVFRFYFEQNILYLEEYARAIDFVIARASDVDAVDVLTRFRAQIVEREIPANYRFLVRLGGTPLSPLPESMCAATRDYTGFLLRVTSRETTAHALAALLPCQWSYGEIASKLAGSMPDDPIYADWIAMFANPEYDLLVERSNDLLDRLAEPGEANFVALSTIFDQSVSYEFAFWQMAYTRDSHVGTPASNEVLLEKGNNNGN